MPMAADMPDSNGGNGIHRSLLDTAATDSRGCRPGGVSGECTSRQECSGTQDRCSQLSVASIPAPGRIAQGIISARTRDLRYPLVAAASRLGLLVSMLDICKKLSIR